MDLVDHNLTTFLRILARLPAVHFAALHIGKLCPCGILFFQSIIHCCKYYDAGDQNIVKMMGRSVCVLLC